MKIFVSIVSYRDPLLKETVKSLLETHSQQHQISIGIFEQTAKESSLFEIVPEYKSDERIKYKRIDPEYSEGVGWARYINSLQLTDEDFYYQIDSHMLFDQDWDIHLIEDWNLARNKHDSDKIIIGANCKNFNILEDGTLQKELHPDITCKIKYFHYDRKNYLVCAHGDYIIKTEHVEPAIHACAGNFFTHSSWVKDVGPDPRIFFEGEEQINVLRSFSAGYHTYHPRSIHAYHYMKTHEYPTKQWFEPIDPTKLGLRMYRSFQYLKEFMLNYSKEDLQKYYEYSGVDHINRRLDERAITRSVIIPEEILLKEAAEEENYK